VFDSRDVRFLLCIASSRMCVQHSHLSIVSLMDKCNTNAQFFKMKIGEQCW